MCAEITDKTDNTSHPARPGGWLFYDGDCRLCRTALTGLLPFLRRVGMTAAPLQQPWVIQKLRIAPEHLMDEMRVLTSDGQILGGADAVRYLVGRFDCLTPIYLAMEVPGVMALLRRMYRWVAQHRRCGPTACPPQM